jgi:hypothetical protein
MLPAVARMTGIHHHTQSFSVEMGSWKLFYWGWPGSTILPISASWIATLPFEITELIIGSRSI